MFYLKPQGLSIFKYQLWKGENLKKISWASYIAITIMLQLCATESQARAPTKFDEAFCERYALTMQRALEVERNLDPESIRTFRQSILNDPQAEIFLSGIGMTQMTPPWILDISDQSREHCLAEVRSDRRGYLPNDPDGQATLNTPDKYVEGIVLLPSK